MKKFERIAETLLSQIDKGDFSLSGVPSERVLAEMLAANRLTVRKSLVLLADRGIIRKMKNGRYEIVPQSNGSSPQLKIAFLVPPSFSSGNIRIWYEELQLQAARHGFLLRPFLFVHWNDVSISEILASFDGIFIVPPAEDIPQDMLARLRSTNGVVILNSDMSHRQILSINLFPAIFVRQALGRLAELSHLSIACLHLHDSINDVLNDRIEQWEYWSALNDNHAPLVKALVNPFNEGAGFLDSQIKTGRFGDATAVFCTTIHAAIALIRACRNNGVNPENGYAVFTIDDEGIGMHSTPSVGCFHKPEIQRMLRPVFRWIRDGGSSRDWKGPLLIEPSDLQIHEGETFHSPPKA